MENRLKSPSTRQLQMIDKLSSPNHLNFTIIFTCLILSSFYSCFPTISKRRKRHLQPTIVITEPPKLAQTYAYIPNSNCAVVKHKTVNNPPWTWSNNFFGTSVYCCQSLFRAFTRCWTDPDKYKTSQSKTNTNQVLSNRDQVPYIMEPHHEKTCYWHAQ